MMNLYLICLICTSIQLISAFQGVFWDICDLHLNISFKSDENGGIFGNYKKDSSIGLIKSTFRNMKDIYPNPNFIFVNGDNVYHGDNDFLDNIKSVSDELTSQFPDTIILPTLGNHDVNPRNKIKLDSKWCETFYKIWSVPFHSMKSDEIELFKKGCFYSRSINSKNGTITVVVLNTLIWYSRNDIDKISDDPFNQFSWLEHTLQNARNLKNKVFLVGHVPPGSSEYSTFIIKHLHPKFNQKLLSIMQNYSDVIDAGFFAHQHTDAFKIVFDSKDKPVIPLFQSPSVTPFYLSKIGSVNPSIRLYYWNNTNAESKYHQFHTHLVNNSSLNWTLEYFSKSILPDLSANSLNNLLIDMEKSNSTHFKDFFGNHLSGQLHDDNSCSFNSYCRCQLICSMRNIDYTKLDLCMNKCPLKTSNFLILVLWITLGSIIILTMIGVLVNVFYFRKRNKINKSENVLSDL